MTLTVRLEPELERKLDAACKRRRVTKSMVVTGLIEEFVACDPEASSYQVAARLGVAPGDTLEVEISVIGVLRNTVVAA